MDATRNHAPPLARLSSAVGGDGLLFQFPRDLGTPELLQLAMQCGDSAVMLAYSSPAAEHLVSAFADGLAAPPIRAGLMTLAAAQREMLARRADALLYFSAPLGDSKLFQALFFDSRAVALGENELKSLLAEPNSAPQHFAAQKNPTSSPSPMLSLSVDDAAPPSILIQSPSPAVCRAAAEQIPGATILDLTEGSLLADAADAMRQNRAEWGAWIDAEGGSLQIFAADGAPLPPESVLEAIAIFRAPSKSMIVLEENAASSVAARLRRSGLRVGRCRADRRAMALALLERGAVLGGGPSGRIWLGGEIASADAVAALRLWAAGAHRLLRAAPSKKPRGRAMALSVAAA